MKNSIGDEFPEFANLNDGTKRNSRTKRSIDLYKKISIEAQRKNWEVIFTSGFAFDAHIGHITRDHRDIDLMISEDESVELVEFLRNEGHDVYTVEKSKGEMLKIDGTDPEKPTSAHGDIHYFWNDHEGKATIPLYGKLLKFSTDSNNLYNEIEFLGIKSKFLKPEYLLEEKIGWQNQVGLTGREEENEIRKKQIRRLIELTK